MNSDTYLHLRSTAGRHKALRDFPNTQKLFTKTAAIYFRSRFQKLLILFWNEGEAKIKTIVWIPSGWWKTHSKSAQNPFWKRSQLFQQ